MINIVLVYICITWGIKNVSSEICFLQAEKL